MDFSQFLGFLVFLFIFSIGVWLLVFILSFVVPYWLFGSLRERFKENRTRKKAQKEQTQQ